VNDPAARPEVGDHWMRLHLHAGDWSCGEQVRELLTGNRPLAEHAAAAYVRRLWETGDTSRLQAFIRRNESWLRESDFTWGSIGSALAGVRDYRATLEWMADWRERPAAEPWMLVNTIEALRAVGRTDEAVEVSRAALAAPPHGGQQLHHLWLAVDAAAAGDARAAEEHLAQVNVDLLTVDWMVLAESARGLVAMEQSPPEDRGSVFAEVRRRLAAAIKAYAAFDHEPGHRRALRQCARQITRRRGTLFAWLWYGWMWFRSHVAIV
jgi:hypothetical protein